MANINIPSPTSCDDDLGIDSWRADEDCARKEKRNTASVRTPDLGRGNLGEARPAGPPGSAPLWNEGGDGRYSASPQSGGEENGGRGSTRSKDVVQEAWKEVARGARTGSSDFMVLTGDLEVHRRMEEMSGSGQYDFRSDAEMNWATSSKGRTMMDFQQFDEACLGMTKGLGAAESTRRQATFYSVLLEACRTIGRDQQVNGPANRPATECLVRPDAVPPESPLRGSFPAETAAGQTISPNDSGRWLLRSARRKENAEPRQRNQREEEDEDRKRSERRGRQQQHPHAASTAGGLSDRAGHGSSCSPPPREGAALVDGGGDGQRATVTSAVGRAICADGSGFFVTQKADRRFRSWPPAWVKQCADSSSGGDDARDSSKSHKRGIVLARGIFAAGSAQAVANTGSQVKALDTRLLMGSVSQKALLLQEELRSNRARLLEIQRHPGRGPAALSQCGTSPRNDTRADEKSDTSTSPTAGAGAGGGGGGASSRDCCDFLEDTQRSCRSQQPHCRAHPSAADSRPASRAVNASAEGSGTAPPESTLCCAALVGYRFSGASCVDTGDNSGDKTVAGRAGPGGAADGVDSLDGSLSTGSLSTGTGKCRAAGKGIRTVVRRVQAVVLRDLLREGTSPPGHGFTGARPGSRVSTPGGVTPGGKWAGEARGRNKQSRLG
ncbi:unnamed protein product, partial [Ectocarpus sp. 12 AP-2014]